MMKQEINRLKDHHTQTVWNWIFEIWCLQDEMMMRFYVTFGIRFPHSVW